MLQIKIPTHTYELQKHNNILTASHQQDDTKLYRSFSISSLRRRLKENVSEIVDRVCGPSARMGACPTENEPITASERS